MLVPRSVLVNLLDSNVLDSNVSRRVLRARFARIDARIQFPRRRDGLIHRGAEILDAAQS